LNNSRGSDNVIFFSPFQGVWQYTFPEALIAEAVSNYEADVVYLTCNGVYSSYCVVMSAFGLTHLSSIDEKEKVCKNCIAHKHLIMESYGFKNIDIDSLLDESDMRYIDEFLVGVNSGNYTSIVIDNCNIGLIAVQDTIRKHKKLDIVLNEQEMAEYIISLKNCIITLIAIKKVCRDFQPSKFFVYNAAYPINNTCYTYAKSNGVLPFVLHAGFNWYNGMEKMIISKGYLEENKDILLKEWLDYNSCPVDNEMIVKETTEHFIFNILSKTVFNYSAKLSDSFDFYEKYKISYGKKIYLATMSSVDEVFALEVIGQYQRPKNMLFNTQIEWILWLISFFEKKSDSFLIIRPHPREFCDKRSKTISKNAFFLREALADLPANVAVNFPDDGTSLYDLAKETDVLLSYQSTSSLDLMALGIPCVVYSAELQRYPSDMYYSPELNDLKSYEMAISRALKDGWSIGNTVAVYRWMSFLSKSEFDISGAVEWKSYGMPVAEEQKLVDVKKHLNGMQIKDIQDFVFSSSASKITKELFNLNVDKNTEETMITKELERLISFFPKNSKLYRNYYAYSG